MIIKIFNFGLGEGRVGQSLRGAGFSRERGSIAKSRGGGAERDVLMKAKILRLSSQFPIAPFSLSCSASHHRTC
jgi:hypothetical protein